MTEISHDTRRRILDATVKVIDANGEAAVRLIQVARSASVTPSVISYHFGSREQLVAEAQAERYIADSHDDARRLADAVERSSCTDEFRTACAEVLCELISVDRTANRFKRASALGAGIERPDLRSMLGDQQRTVIEHMATSLAAAQRRGLLHADLDPMCVAEIVCALSFGVVLTDIDGCTGSRDGMVAVLDRFLGSLVAA